MISLSNIEVPPPPPVEKLEMSMSKVSLNLIQQRLMLGIQFIFHWIEAKKQVLVHLLFFLAWSIISHLFIIPKPFSILRVLVLFWALLQTSRHSKFDQLLDQIIPISWYYFTLPGFHLYNFWYVFFIYFKNPIRKKWHINYELINTKRIRKLFNSIYYSFIKKHLWIWSRKKGSYLSCPWPCRIPRAGHVQNCLNQVP